MSNVDIVKESFGRCDSPEFYDTIYDIFLGKSDEVKRLFANTDVSDVASFALPARGNCSNRRGGESAEAEQATAIERLAGRRDQNGRRADRLHCPRLRH